LQFFNPMVEQQSAHLDSVFHALADPTRRGMLRSLAGGARSIGELAAPLRMSFAGASKHVKSLERAGLVRRTVQGRQHLCRLDAARLADADEWLRFYQRFWTARLDALERELRKPELASESPKNQNRKKR
jgi:DNA-binding transcriptional ArsR family regulator